MRIENLINGEQLKKNSINEQNLGREKTNKMGGHRNELRYKFKGFEFDSCGFGH